MLCRLGRSDDSRPGPGHRLAEGGVDPAVGGHLGGERLAVGGAELLHLAVAEQHLDDGVLAPQRLEGAGVGRVARLGLPPGLQAQVLVEHGAQLLDRVDVERGAGQLVHGGLERLALGRQLGGDGPQHLAVDRDPHDLHAGQHPDERPLHVVEQGALADLGQRRAAAARAAGPARRPGAPGRSPV